MRYRVSLTACDSGLCLWHAAAINSLISHNDKGTSAVNTKLTRIISDPHLVKCAVSYKIIKCTYIICYINFLWLLLIEYLKRCFFTESKLVLYYLSKVDPTTLTSL